MDFILLYFDDTLDDQRFDKVKVVKIREQQLFYNLVVTTDNL